MRFGIAATLVLLNLAAAQDLTVVSAASYREPVTPESWAAAFGSGLALSTLSAEPGDDGRLPFELGGVAVEVDGEPAAMGFVSPLQVNFVVPDNTEPGIAMVAVTTPTGRLSDRLEVAAAAPALFSLDLSGNGPGAILNAATFEEGPFFVETEEIKGEDQRTRLAVFGTGFRNADRLEAVITSPDAPPLLSPVEFFGPAPGFAGLDQANVILAPELDCANIASIALRTTQFRSNAVTFGIRKLPHDRLHLRELSLSQDGVAGGASLTGSVGLNGCAPAGGFPVSLETSSLTVTTPDQVVIPGGEAQETFTIRTMRPPVRVTVEIRARSEGRILSSLLTVDPTPVELADITFEPEVALGGLEAVGSIELETPQFVPVTVDLTSSVPSIVTVPETVLISPGLRTADFLVSIKPVDDVVNVIITAAVAGSRVDEILTVRPLLTLSARPTSVEGGESFTLDVELGEPAPLAGARVDLHTDSLLLFLPLFLHVPEGATRASERIDTLSVATDQDVEITASYRGVSDSVSVTLTAPRLLPGVGQAGRE